MLQSSKSIFLFVATSTLALALAGCGTDAPSNNDNGATNASTNSTQNNEPNCLGNLVACGGACVNTRSDVDNCGACGAACGTGASCLDSECTCVNGAVDCNGDLGAVGSDGCECNGTCDGTTCDLSECDETEAFSCSDADTTACSAGTCVMCTTGRFNCDGLGSNGCECEFACVNGACPECDPNAADACGGDTGMWCDDGTCAACEVGTTNCDTTGDCECDGDCDGTMCTPAGCTYEMENACNNDDSMWCSSVADNTCVSCSTGFFNCNNKLGCECDSAGCDGEVCAGACMSGLAEECP